MRQQGLGRENAKKKNKKGRKRWGGPPIEPFK